MPFKTFLRDFSQESPLLLLIFVSLVISVILSFLSILRHGNYSVIGRVCATETRGGSRSRKHPQNNIEDFASHNSQQQRHNQDRDSVQRHENHEDESNRCVVGVEIRHHAEDPLNARS